MGILIKGGRVIDPANGIDDQRDVLIDGGTISRVAKRIPAAAHTIIDARGGLVTPGLVDMHVHLREPGNEDKETVETGSRAGLGGGFTSLACMANTNPVIDNAEVVAYVAEHAAAANLCSVFVIGAVTKNLAGEELTEIAELHEAGVVALSDDGMPVMDTSLLRRALECARAVGLPIISHCEDRSLSDGGSMHEGLISTRLGLPGIPGCAESIHVARDMFLAQLTGGHIHIAHCSAAQSVELIRFGKRWGIPLTAETAPHYFTLSDEAVDGYNTNAKMNPPLQTAGDMEGVRGGLQDGTLDAIATDHAPHTPVDKANAFTEAPFGIIGLETAFAVAYTQLVEPGHLPLDRVVAQMTCNPAKILQLPHGIGTLAPGAQGDVTVFDLESDREFRVADSASKSRNSPFDGWTLKSRVQHVVARGRHLVQDGVLGA